MKKLYLLLGIIFLFSFTLVSSVQTVIVNSNPQTGLDIFYPQFDSIKANTGFHLHVHTANKSTGLQLNNTVVDCGLQLSNSSGYQTFTKFLIDKDINGIDHELYIEAGNFSDLGKNSFSIFCNATKIGGEVEGTFIVTPNGESGTDNLIFYIVLLLLLYTLTFIFFFNRIPSFTALSGMALGSFGLYITTSGFIIFQNWITTYLSYITISIGFGLSIWALIEWIQEL